MARASGLATVKHEGMVCRGRSLLAVAADLWRLVDVMSREAAHAVHVTGDLAECPYSMSSFAVGLPCELLSVHGSVAKCRRRRACGIIRVRHLNP